MDRKRTKKIIWKNILKVEVKNVNQIFLFDVLEVKHFVGNQIDTI